MQARLLVTAGGSPTLKDRWRYSALDLAHKVMDMYFISLQDHCVYVDCCYINVIQLEADCACGQWISTSEAVKSV